MVMALGYLYYEQRHFRTAEELLLQSEDVCKDHLLWATNLAHVIFVQGGRYHDAIDAYRRVQHRTSRLSDVTPVILANLCVSYILTNQVRLLHSFLALHDWRRCRWRRRRS